MVKNQFRTQLTDADISGLVKAAPKDLIEDGGHLHHTLVKLGRERYRDRILAVQKLLWDNGKGIDPFMSVHIFVIAPMKGVHTNDAIEFVLSQLETFWKQTPKPSKARVPAELQRISALAQKGKLGK